VRTALTVEESVEVPLVVLFAAVVDCWTTAGALGVGRGTPGTSSAEAPGAASTNTAQTAANSSANSKAIRVEVCRAAVRIRFPFVLRSVV